MKNLQQLRAARERGFTLIELIIVIVIIGILAAVAIPKYQDITNQAKVAVLQGLAGSLSSASTTNYALKMSGNGNAKAVTDCSITLTDFLDSIPSTVTLTIAAADPLPTGATQGTKPGDTLYCTLTDSVTGNTAPVTLIRTEAAAG